MNIKNKKISKKDWYLENINKIIKDNFIDDFIENHCGIIYSDDEFGNRDCVPSGKITEDDFDIDEYYYEEAIEFIKNDLIEYISDDLTCIDGIGGKRHEQLGMIEFINLFSNLNFELDDFHIVEDDYCFKVMFVKYKQKFGYLETFFGEFVYNNAEKILNEVINFNNNKGKLC
jgi:hypothetical protein